MRISDWSSDVCSSDLIESLDVGEATLQQFGDPHTISIRLPAPETTDEGATNAIVNKVETALSAKFPGATFSRYATVSGKVSGELVRNGILAVVLAVVGIGLFAMFRFEWQFGIRSEEHTSELQSLMRISYAVFCLKK